MSSRRKPHSSLPAALAVAALSAGLAGGAQAQDQQSLPPAPTGTPLTVHGNVEGPNRLVIVQVCEPQAACRLFFVDTLKQDDVPALVLRQRGQGRPGTDPSVTVQALCAGNWVAAVHAGSGNELSQGLVCGYPTEMAALQAAFSACEKQGGRKCGAGSPLRVSWGRWDGRNLPGRDEAPGKLYDVWTGDGAQRCELDAGKPLACEPATQEILRKAGVL